MKQLNFKIKSQAQKHLKPWLMNWTDQCISEKLLRKKLFVLECITLTKLFHILHDKSPLVLCGEQEIVTK